MKPFVIAAAIATLAATSAFAQTAAKHAADVPAAAPSELPADIKTYVTTHESTPLTYEGKVMLGHGLDGELVYQSIPAYPAYRWTNVNGQRVVVEKATRHVVAIY